MGRLTRLLHKTGNWFVITDCSNDFNVVKRTVVLAEVTYCMPVLTPLVAKCYGLRPADLFCFMDSGETREVACSSGVQKEGGPIERETSCLALRPGLKCLTEEFEGEGGENLRVHERDLSRSHEGRGTPP